MRKRQVFTLAGRDLDWYIARLLGYMIVDGRDAFIESRRAMIAPDGQTVGGAYSDGRLIEERCPKFTSDLMLCLKTLPVPHHWEWRLTYAPGGDSQLATLVRSGEGQSYSHFNERIEYAVLYAWLEYKTGIRPVPTDISSV